MGNLNVAAEFSFRKASKAQACLAEKVTTEDCLPKDIRLVAGVDAAYFGDYAFGSVAVLDYCSLEILEIQIATQRVKVPYIPTFLSFRELPVVAACVRKLQLRPDVFLIDGHGKAHPRECGFASHLGVVLSKPTVGVAKSWLVGEPKRVGENTFLIQKKRVVGAVVTTVDGAKPVYVSVGNMISLETAIKIVKHCSRGNRVPEPIRAAHNLASTERKAKIAVLTLNQ